jgi:diguanylate cyclase (GGDEF)-like protein/PAS domain S-box-containing protein
MLVDRKTMRYVEVNATACNILGYTREELFLMGPAQIDELPRAQLESLYDSIIAGCGPKELRETRARRKDGSQLQVEVRCGAHRFGADWVIVGVLRDVTERKEAEKSLEHLAHYDTVTGLPNRTLFYEILAKTVAQAPESGRLTAVLLIDLDRFKNVNDTLGHAVGDELLREVSNRLVQCVHIRDTVGRLGGDEFALILVTHFGAQNAIMVADKIRDALRAPFTIQGKALNVTASIGITVHPADASDPETLLKYADMAMYQAKLAGRDTYRFFTAAMNAELLARLELEAALRQAVENEEFVLYYQPKVQLDSGRIVGVEALLRWQRPGHGLLPPAGFITVLEQTGLIVPVGSWVIATACRQIGLWMRSAVGPLQVSVNVSERQFNEGDLAADVVRAIGDNGIAAELLELELTESCLMQNTGRTVASLQDFRRRGVQISIDDFGTGYSSLAYLRRFPIDKLKIDIAFVRGITSNDDDAAIALTIINMAHSLKLKVIAEGVETPEQLAHLRSQGCDQIQGFLFSEPLSAPELERMIGEGKCLPAASCGCGKADDCGATALPSRWQAGGEEVVTNEPVTNYAALAGRSAPVTGDSRS